MVWLKIPFCFVCYDHEYGCYDWMWKNSQFWSPEKKDANVPSCPYKYCSQLFASCVDLNNCDMPTFPTNVNLGGFCGYTKNVNCQHCILALGLTNNPQRSQ